MIFQQDDEYYDVNAKCVSCGKSFTGSPYVVMTGYAEKKSELILCKTCAVQLARKLLEDVCELEGDRHG